jgi:Ni,Fe-hydrogenase III component G
MHKREGEPAWPKCLQCEINKGYGIFAAAEKERRALKLSRNFPKDVYGFRFQVIKII